MPTLDERMIEEMGADEDMMLPSRGFLADYFNFCCPLTEAPEIWHLFMAFTVMGAVVGKKRYLNTGWGKIYPVLWTLFVGMSSSLKKSTVLRYGKDLLWRASLDVVYPTEFSREALLQYLGQNPSGMFVWQEIAGNLQMFEASYMKGTKAMFTDLFDSTRYTRVTKGEKKDSPLTHTIIDGACVSIAAASTLAWLNKAVNESDSDAGFLPRFIFITAEKPSKILAFPEPADERDWQYLVTKIKDIADLPDHQMSLSPEAKEFYTDWYADLQRQILKESELIIPYIKRLEVYMHKFAMLNQINDDRMNPVISVDAYKQANYAVKYLERNIRRLIDTNLFQSEEGRFATKVIRIIRSKGGSMPRGALYRTANPPSDRFLDSVIKVLLDAGQISEYQERTKGRPKTHYLLSEV